jgi:hypothetical protein
MLSLELIFYAYLFALCIHVVDEYNTSGGFINWVRENFYADYNEKKFIAGNGIAFILHLTFTLIYAAYQGNYFILPLFTASVFTFNGIAHLISTVRRNRHSPGLLSSPIYWLLMFFIIKDHLVTGELSLNYFLPGLIIGAILGLGMFSLFNLAKFKK